MSTATTKYIETTNLNYAKRNFILTALDKGPHCGPGPGHKGPVEPVAKVR